MRPISPRPSIIWSRGVRSPISARKATRQRLRRWCRRTRGAPMKARILIVEDEEALSLLLRYNLEAEGYEVDTVARGDEAELRLKEQPPDLLILDWMLPGL